MNGAKKSASPPIVNTRPQQVPVTRAERDLDVLSVNQTVGDDEISPMTCTLLHLGGGSSLPTLNDAPPCRDEIINGSRH